MARSAAPMSSIQAVYLSTMRTRRTIPPIWSPFMLSCKSPLVRREILFRRDMARSIPMVIKPRPPTCIIPRIMQCPRAVQCVPVSTTTSPVTQVEVVAVKRAVRRSVSQPSLVAPGSKSSRVPAIMTSR